MATQVYFGGKTRRLPGTYATVVSGIKTETTLSTYGNVLLIDAGAGEGYNAAVGLQGHGRETILALEKDEALSCVRGGALEPVIEALFTPAANVPGVSTLYLVKAAKSTPARIDNLQLFGGSINIPLIKTREEGAICNSDIDIVREPLQITANTWGIVCTEDGYNAIIPESYRLEYPFEVSEASLPWLWFNFKKTPESRKFYVQIRKDGDPVKFVGTSSNIGTLLADDYILECTAIKGYMGWELINDLNIQAGHQIGVYQIFITEYYDEKSQSVWGNQYVFSVNCTEEGVDTTGVLAPKITTISKPADAEIPPIEDGEIVKETLRKGYLIKSFFDVDNKKAYLEVWMGTYEGQNSAGYQIGNTRENSGPTMIFRSRKCTTPQQLVTALQTSSDWNQLFSVSEYQTTSTSFLETTNELFKFTGGSDEYMENLTEVYSYLNDIDYSFAMVLEKNDTQNFAQSLYEYIKEEAKDIKQMITYNGVFDSAMALAAQYDDDAVIVTTGVVKETSIASPDGFIVHDPMVTAGYVLGRICGLSPEVAATMKRINIDGMDIEPSTENLEDMLDSGVICPYYDPDLGYYCLSQAVNSLQSNSRFINTDCTTYSIQAKRIIAQVMKNLQQRSKIEFWGGEGGVNKGSLSDTFLKTWTRGILEELTLSQDKTINNYLLTYEVTKIETNEDNKFVYFTFTINGEISKVFFTGVVLG